MPALLVATHNSHKTAEIAAILGGDWEVTDLTMFPELAPIEETGATFAENAELKALQAAALSGDLVLADDSGLEVDALAGAPGVRSARYAGENATDAENRFRLLDELARVGARGRHRGARFRCVMVLASKSQVLGTFAGSVEGVILPREKGSSGFGYDCLFVPDGYCETFAELASTVKNQLSHRARALAQVKSSLVRFTRSEAGN